MEMIETNEIIRYQGESEQTHIPKIDFLKFH